MSPYSTIKRILDLTFAVILLPALAVLIAILAPVIFTTSPGPVFFVHRRIGYRGRTLRMIKFRTMQRDAEKAFESFSVSQKQEFFENYKIMNDTRVTPFGKILRATGLDESPQIINILRGEMSFIGPRPIVGAELEKYGACKSQLLSVRPGLSGLWKVNEHQTASYEERIKLELKYAKDVSFGLDFKILIKTICLPLTILFKK